jgi:NitT/TauT family transport system substrate-binding protein
MPIDRRMSLRVLAGASAAAVGVQPALVRAQQAPPSGGGRVTLRVASSADDTITPLLYAQKVGIFDRAGLDVVVQKASSGSAVAAAVAAGAMDLGRGTILPLINAYARGVRFVLVAPSTLHTDADPDSGLLVLKDAPIRSAADLAGKVVSVAGLYDLTWLSTKAWLAANGGGDTVRFIEIPSSAALSALQSGRIAGSTISEPFMSLAIRTGTVRYLGNIVGAIAPTLLESAWYVTADFAAKNRDAIARFRRAIEAATVYTNAHHAETVDLLAEFTGMDPVMIGQIRRATSGTSLDPRLIQPMINVAAKFKVIAQPFSATELLVS